MAKVVITIDTDEETLDVDVGGKKIENAMSASCYREIDRNGKTCYFSVSIQQSEDVDGMRKVTTLYSSDSNEAKKADKEGEAVQSAHAGFVEVEGASDVQKQIESFFCPKD